MPFGHRRTDLQSVAQAKFDDALLLLRERRFSSSYYLAGYAIEIGLKACIARSIFAQTIPDKSFANSIYIYDLKKLVGVAGLLQQLQVAQNRDPDFAANWSVVTEWSHEVRYDVIDPITSQTMIQAVGDTNSGVFPWIKLHW